MKTLIIGAMTAALAFSVIADPVKTTETTTTVTTSSGTLSTYEPGASFIVKETSGPVTYN